MRSTKSALNDAALCLVFFTRLPLPQFDFAGRSLASAIWAAPIAGLVVAIIGALTFALASFLGLPPAISAALALASTMLATGCLHEDGLADVADGFGGGSTPERKLDIMRDSRIGAYGACALVVSILLRWTAIADLATPGDVFATLLAAHIASRGLIAAFMHALPHARQNGLAANAGSVSRDTALAGAALGAVGLLLLGLIGLLTGILALALVLFAFRQLCLRQIGGQTGDTIGAMQQVAEITILVTAAALLS